LSESENNKDFSLNERSLFEKEKVLGSNPTPRTKMRGWRLNSRFGKMVRCIIVHHMSL